MENAPQEQPKNPIRAPLIKTEIQVETNMATMQQKIVYEKPKLFKTHKIKFQLSKSNIFLLSTLRSKFPPNLFFFRKTTHTEAEILQSSI